jgi:ribosomal protein S18 acetylase RimI-like enzyme
LLSHVVHSLGRLGAATVSLNTQASNKASQRLYLQLGFHELLERPMVLWKPLGRQEGRAGV